MSWTTLQRSKLTESLSGWSGGDGPTLLLIHGVGMRAEYWSNLLPALQQHFSLVVIDMPGHGESPALTIDSPAIFDYTDCIANVLLRADEPAFVAGHSMGALITVDLAYRYSKKVRAIAVLNGVYQRDKSASQAVQARADSLDGLSVADPAQTLSRWFGSDPQILHKEAAHQCKSWLSTIDPPGYRDAYRAFAYDNGPSEEVVRNLFCPALFTTGELEPNSTPAMSHAMASLAPQGECSVIKDAKHMMSMTHGDQISALMISFFNGK